MKSRSGGENRCVRRPTPARAAIVAELVASGRLSSAAADHLLDGGRVDDMAWARVRSLYEEQQQELLDRKAREVEAAKPADEDEVLRRIDEAIAALPKAEDCYRAAADIATAASDGLTISLPACHHYAIWSELTDRYELKPDERAAALDAMRRAADEWLTAKDDAVQRTKYFEKWLP